MVVFYLFKPHIECMATQTPHTKRTNSKAPRLPEAYSHKFAHRLRQLRRERGLTQADVAHAVGIAEYTYQKYESAKSTAETNSNPRLGTLYALANVFEIELPELFTMSFDMPEAFNQTDEQNAFDEKPAKSA